MKRRSKKRFCFEYIEPIAKSWKLSPLQIKAVQLAYYKEMGGFGKVPNILNAKEHQKLINTTSRFVSRIRKNIFVEPK
jgi:hypothetical protein